MNFKENAAIHRFTALFACVALPLMALSMSASQTFIYIALFVFVVERIATRDAKGRRWIIPGLFLAGIALYAIYLLSYALHYASFENIKPLFSSEVNDLPFLLFGLVIVQAAAHTEHRKWIIRAFVLFLILLLASGIMALFSEFRLSRIFTGNGFIASAQNRPQHPLLNFAGIQLYRPIGFTSTRLTYAGLLLLSAPFVFLRCLHETGKKRFYWIAMALLLSFLLLANGTRSALFPALLPGLFIFLFFLIRKLFLPGGRWPIAGAVLTLLFLSGAALALRPEGQNAIRKGLLRIERNTDFQRPIIWAGSGELILQNPLVGIGPAAFTEQTIAWRKKYLENHPDLWYFFECSPAKHAHNDLLQAGIAGGIPGMIAFLGIVYFALRRRMIVKSEGPLQDDLVSSGGVAMLLFFLAGTFQCYFLDDRVAEVFWTLAGLSHFNAWENKHPYSAPQD